MGDRERAGVGLIVGGDFGLCLRGFFRRGLGGGRDAVAQSDLAHANLDKGRVELRTFVALDLVAHDALSGHE